MREYLKQYIDGQWVESEGGKRHEVISPSTEEPCTVITLGTPFARLTGATNVEWLYELVNGRPGRIGRALERTLRAPPPVPTTSIYSRSDGVVAWQACVGEPSPRAENIEVDSSHLGLVWHPDVFRIVADRLAQRPGRWRPWVRRRAMRARA